MLSILLSLSTDHPQSLSYVVVKYHYRSFKKSSKANYRYMHNYLHCKQMCVRFSIVTLIVDYIIIPEKN